MNSFTLKLLINIGLFFFCSYIYAIEHINDVKSNAIASNDSITLTEEEQKWLSHHPVIRVAMDPDWAPIEYKDVDGQFQGISIDYLSIIEKKLGVQFTPLKDLSWQEAVQAVKDKQADMFVSVTHTVQRKRYVNFTEPYLTIPIRIFARNNISYIGSLENISNERIAIVDNYAIHEILIKEHPELNLVPVDTPAEALQQLSEGKVDLFIGNLITATYYIEKLGFPNIREKGETGYNNKQAMAVRKDWPILANILQKSLNSIPENEHQNIFNRWMSIKFEQKINYEYIWTILSILVSIFLIILYWNRKKSATQLLAEQQRTEEILKGTNAGTWYWDIDTKELIINDRWAEIVGYTLEELSPVTISTWSSSLHPDDLKVAEKELEKHFANEIDYYDVEFRQKHKKGDWIWVSARGKVAVWNEDGTPKRMTGTHLDITGRKIAEEQLMHQAHFDALTGLPNRFLSLDRLSKLIINAQRNNKKVGVFFLDLDDFKKINDTLGHDVGDEVLSEAAKRLQGSIRHDDTVGRLGGDEFIVLVNELDDFKDSSYIAKKLLDSFQEPFIHQDRELRLSASIGISIYPDDGKNATELLKNADSAMYHSKREGRKTFSYFTDAMNKEINRRLFLEEQMHGAIERNEFRLCYQQKININTGEIIGAEALLRWCNDKLGDISPEEFIPLAEHTGQIISLGQFVLKEALSAAAEWQTKYNPSFSIAINLSPSQFRDSNLVSSIEDTIKKTGVNKSLIEFEITEGIFISGLSQVSDAMIALTNMGISFAMDDFGTGYSSLNYLRKYPFKTLKIDRSFVNDIAGDKADLALVNAAIAMAHGLGLTVVAEGVENEEQLTLLQDNNCDLAQGYFIGKPVPPEVITELLINNS